MWKYETKEAGSFVASSTTIFQKYLPEVISFACCNPTYKQIKSPLSAYKNSHQSLVSPSVPIPMFLFFFLTEENKTSGHFTL